MIITLNISPSCIIKEFEMIQEDIQAKMQTDPTYTDTRTRQFIQAIDQLGIKRRCICHDPSCSQWDDGYCRCNGNPYCRNLSYEFLNRFTEFVPTPAERTLATKQLQAKDLLRLPDEPFIVWKARTESLIWNVAEQIRDIPETGKTEYFFSSGAPTSEVRTRQFQAYVRDVRDLGRTSATLDYTAAVGCSICERVYLTQQNLFDHVDRCRTQGDSNHNSTVEITPTVVIPVRPTPSDYVLPVITPPASASSRNIIATYDRDDDWDDVEWHDNLREFVREDRRTFPLAVGCVSEGNVYRDVDAFLAHVHRAHDDIIQRTLALINYGVF